MPSQETAAGLLEQPGISQQLFADAWQRLASYQLGRAALCLRLLEMASLPQQEAADGSGGESSPKRSASQEGPIAAGVPVGAAPATARGDSGGSEPRSSSGKGSGVSARAAADAAAVGASTPGGSSSGDQGRRARCGHQLRAAVHHEFLAALLCEDGSENQAALHVRSAEDACKLSGLKQIPLCSRI